MDNKQRNALIAIVLLLVISVGGLMVSTTISKKSHADEVKVSNDASYYKGKHYEDVVTEMKSYGFEDVSTRKIEDLITGWLTSDGEVESVSIDGKTDFTAGKYFSQGAKVVVAYHTFPEKTETVDNARKEDNSIEKTEKTSDIDITDKPEDAVEEPETNITEEMDEQVDEVEEDQMIEEEPETNLEEYRINLDRDEMIPELYRMIVENDYMMKDIEKAIDVNRLVVYEYASDNLDYVVYYNISTVGCKNPLVYNMDFKEHYAIRIYYDKEHDSIYTVELRSPEGKTIEEKYMNDN